MQSDSNPYLGSPRRADRATAGGQACTGICLADFTSQVRQHRTKIAALAVALVLMLSLIGMQNAPYWDDAARRLTGETRWGAWDGRLGSEIVAVVLNQGFSVVDLGITTFVLSGLILAAAWAVIVFTLAGTRANWLTYVLALAAALNPWYLNAAAFRFDGPFFALSVLFAAGTSLFVRTGKLPMLLAYTGLTLVTANFFQPMLGLSLVLLATVLLLDWLRGFITLREVLVRLGIGVGGVALGALTYLAQTQIMSPGRADVLFAFDNPIRAILLNTRIMAFSFLTDSSPVWTVFHLLVLALFIVGVLLLSRREPSVSGRPSLRGTWPTIVALLVYFLVVVLASGNLLLLIYQQNLIGTPRFSAVLAMSIGIFGIVASTFDYPKPLLIAGQIVLAIFSYLWLSLVFVFNQVLSEQNASLEFQAQTIAASMVPIYRTGDIIIYDSRVFANPLYLSKVQSRFPIFNVGTYHNTLDFAFSFVRDRFPELMGLSQAQVLPLELDGANRCELPRLESNAIIRGPRWEVFRIEPNVVCLLFPADFITVESGADGIQIIEFEAARFPFNPGTRPNFVELPASAVRLAVWSKHNPDDLRWFTPDTWDAGTGRFVVPAPPGGWYRDELVGHFYLGENFIHQIIWSID